MKYGHFDDKNREYVITDPMTPWPWINYLGQEAFFSLVSNTGGGYSFYRDARLRRITRYRYNNVPVDDNGKYFYINDDGDIWSPGWKPVKAGLRNYECRHGLGYTIIKGERNHITAEVLYFVPLGTHAEVQKIRISNNSTGVKKIKLFSYAEWNLWNALDDMTNFQRNYSTGEVEIEGSALYHKTEYRERRNHYAFYWVNREINGFDTDREIFMGLYNSPSGPRAVVEGKPGNSKAQGWSPVASHYLEIELQPGKTEELVFVLGYVENQQEEKFTDHPVINKEKAYALTGKFNTVEQVEKAFEDLKSYWDDHLNVFQLGTPDEKLGRMVNIWNPYQCMVTFNFSRSASYFESGIGRGMGFRDSNQDLIGFVHMEPELSKQRILDLAATQLEDGGAYHQYQPLTKKGNNDIGGNFNDDPMWLVLSVSSYIKETGDWSILDEKVDFDNDPSKADTLFEHLRRSFRYNTERLGPHNLPLIGRADWNDCLNLNCFSNNPDEPFQTTENKSEGVAESLMIAGQFILYGEEYIKICEKLDNDEEIALARVAIDRMNDAVNVHGWDGEWFLRAYDNFSRKVGSHENDEGKIFIESQGFCIMAGIGLNDGRAEKALESVHKMLACEYGIVLNDPAFTKYYIELGEISTYPQGYKENAGIFCHNNPWIMIAETMVGNGDRAFDYYSRIAPAYLEDISDLHKTEPYVYSQMIAGKDAVKPGEAKNSWLTGTAAWNYYAITQYILGIRPDYDGMIIDPAVPKDWDGFTVRRKFRGSVFEITVKNPDHVSSGVRTLSLNGKELPSNLVPVQEKKGNYKVVAILG